MANVDGQGGGGGGRGGAPVGPPGALAVHVDAMNYLNGEVYIANESGETEQYKLAERVVICPNTPGSQDTQFFLENVEDETSAVVPAIGFNAVQAFRFMCDQYCHLKLKVGNESQKYTNEGLLELVIIRYLAYRHRLSCAQPVMNLVHVTHNDVEITDPALNGSTMHDLRQDAGYAATEQEFNNLLNANRHLRFLTNNFSNIVCCVAYNIWSGWVGEWVGCITLILLSNIY